MSRVDNALLLRDTIQKIVDDKIGKTNPGASYATVTGFNPALGIITVRYPGDDVDIEIPAGSIYPSEPGQIVRIEGPTGSRVVADVKGENLTEVKARTAQETADGKNTVNYGETPPEGTDHKDGDIWFDEGNSNMPNVWRDGQWVTIEDLRVSAIEAAQAELREDLDTVVENGVGTKSFYKPTQPTEAESKEGDLWFDTSEGGNNELHTYVNGAWVSTADARIAAIQQAQAEIRQELDDIVIDGSGTKNFYTPDMPTEGMSEGDLWFDGSDKNKPYIYQDGEWITVRDQFVKPSTSLNVTDWGMLQPNMKAIQGQWSSTDYRVELETSDDLGGQSLGVVNIPAGETGGGFITLPFQGVLSGSDSPGYSDDLFVNEGRPIGLDLQLLYSGPFEPSAGQRTLTAHYFADGELVDSGNIDYSTLSREVFPAAPDFNNPTAFYANLLGYQFGMRVTGTVLPTTMASADEIALTVAIPLPAGSGAEKKLAVWSIDSRVQVPSTGLADGAVTETKVSDDAISTPKLQAQSIVAGKIAVNAIETDHLDSKIITTDKIAVGAITAESGVVASLDAGKITVGTLDAARIAANSITADKVLIGSDRNLLPNGDLNLGDATGWPGSPTYRTSNGPPSNVAGSPNVFYTGTSTINMATWGRFPVKDGDVLMFECWVKADKANSKIFMEVRDQDGAHLSSAGSNNWTSVEGGAAGSAYPISSWTVPTSWTKVISRLYVQGVGTREAYLGSFYLNHTAGTERGATYYLAGMKLYKAVGSTLIEPGAITTEKIATGAITAQSGIIASLDAGKITVGTLAAARFAANTINADSILVNGSLGSTIIKKGAITTEKIATGAITAESGVIGSLDASKITVGKLSGARLEADAINGMQIIGATIATSTSFPRVQLDTAGIAVYKSSTVRSFFADAKTGNLDLVGNLATATSGNERVVLDNALWNSIEVVDEEGALAGPVAGSGVRVGVGDQSTLDLFHAGRSFATSTGSYVDYGAIMGPRPTGQSRGAMLSLSRTIRSNNSEFNWAALDVGKANGYYTARMGVTDADESAFINANGPVRVTSERFFSVSTTGRGARMYIKENSDLATNYQSGLYVETNAREPVVINKIERPGYVERTSLSLQYNGDTLAGLMATKGYHANVSSYGDTLGIILNGMVNSADGSKLTVNHDGQAELHGSDIRPLTIKYYGTAASWIVPFSKRSTEWGYIGSTGAMSADDFGIQSAAGKRLVLNAGTGSARITLGTDGSITGLPIATGDGVDFPTVAANGGSQTVTINFPSGKFSVAPSVSAMTSHGRVTPVVFNITKTGFSFRVWNFTSSSAPSVVGTWMAVAAS